MGRETQETVEVRLLKETETQHRLLWTKRHYEALRIIPPKIFDRAEAADTLEIALLTDDEIREEIRVSTEPPLSSSSLEELKKKASPDFVRDWLEQLSRFSQVLVYFELEKNKIFSSEERAEFKKKWGEMLTQFGIELAFPSNNFLR